MNTGLPHAIVLDELAFDDRSCTANSVTWTVLLSDGVESYGGDLDASAFPSRHGHLV